MSRFIQLPIVVGLKPIDFEVESYVFIKKSNIPLSSTYARAINDFIKGLKEAGMFDLFYAIYIYPFIEEPYRGLNLIDANLYKLTFGTTTEHTNEGIIPHSSGIETGIVFADLDNFSTNMSFLHYSTFPSNVDFKLVEAISSNGGYNFTLYMNEPGQGQYRFDMVNNTTSLVASNVKSKGLGGVNALGTTRAVYENGVLLASRTAAGGTVAGNLMINLTNATRNNLKTYQMHLIGKGLTEAQHLTVNGLVDTFMSKIGITQ